MKAIEIDDNKMALSNEAKQEVPAEKEAGVEVEKKIITESEKGGPNNADPVQVQLGVHANSGVVSESSNIKPIAIMGRKKELSIADAAALIQAAYRGFEVRKWEPMKKMKQIAKVHDQIADIKERIKELEASGDLQQYEKQRLIIGETIMNLLLQLDTIQGLHPSVREVRKSVAKELVCLQEKLNSVPVQKTGRPMTTLPESVPLRKVLEDYPKAFEDASLSTVTQAETAASANLTMTGKATSEEEVVKQTAAGKIQLHENEHAETESSLVEDEGLKTGHELSVDPSPPSEDKISSSESEQLLEDPTLGNGSLDVATVLVESLPSTDQEQRLVPPESIVLEGETKTNSEAEGCMQLMRDEAKTDSEAEGSMQLMIDEACVSAAEQEVGMPSNQKDEEPPSEPVLAEEPQKDEELALGAKFTVVQSADDIKVEPHFELPEGSKDMNPLQECEQTSLAKDSRGDCVMVAPVESSAREGEPELGIRELLVVAEPAEKYKEQKCRTVVEMGTPSPGSLAEATGNDALELPPEMTVKAGSSLEDLPILSEITVGFNSAADKHAQYPEVGSFDAFAPVKDVDKLVYEGSEMVELETPVMETENATVAENVLDKSLETEAAEKEAAEAENKPASAAMKVLLELGGTNQPPNGLKFSEGIAAEVESPVSKPSSAPVATTLLSPGLEILKALENQDGSLSLEAAGVPIVDSGTHCLEVTDAVSASEDPSTAETWKGSAVSDDVELRKENEKAMGRTEDLKEMLEKLIEAGKQQLTLISDLNERVRDLEKKLAQKKKLKVKKRSVAVRPSCMKNVNARLEGAAAATVV